MRKKLIRLVIDDPDAYTWGGETILVGDAAVGEIASTGWSPKAGRCVALAYVRAEAALQPHQGTAARVDLWGDRTAARLFDL
jgi:dimethylglycine oxidase